VANPPGPSVWWTEETDSRRERDDVYMGSIISINDLNQWGIPCDRGIGYGTSEGILVVTYEL
jgi:hypothetical protein